MLLLAAGDQAAFAELYHRYKDRMYYYFYRMLGNSAGQANDFLQELFLKVIERPESYDPKYSFQTWFYSVANNMCKNEYRRREIREEYRTVRLTEPALEYPEEPALQPDRLIEKIFITLNELGEEHRSAFLLRHREGFSIKDIAEVLELPEGTVKSRLFYAKKILAEKLNYLKDEVEF